jgi:hypothetical protein
LLRRAIGASLPQQSVAGSWPNYHQGGVGGVPTGFKPKLIPFALDPQLEGKFRGIAVGACTPCVREVVRRLEMISHFQRGGTEE